jgi:hypothetical protein
LYAKQLEMDPVPMPIQSAILMLKHKRKKLVFFCFTTNARGRAAVLISMIRHRGKSKRAHLSGLPEGGIGDFVLHALNIGIERKDGDRTVAQYQKKAEREGYKLFGNTRSALPKVTLGGKRMSIVEAMKETNCGDDYQTVYKRFLRGWDVKAALGIADRERPRM